MKKEICVVASVEIHTNKGNTDFANEYFTSGDSYWHTAAANQCLATISALVKDGDFLIKVLTPVPSDSKFARKIKSLRPDILLCGFAVEKTQDVAKAIEGAFGVFLVTDTLYDREDSVADEVAIGRAVADACLLCKIPHVVYSTEMHVYASIGLRSDPCDAKAHIADYFANIGLPRTLLVVPFLYENFFFGFFKPKKTNKPDVYRIAAPSGYIPFDMIGINDLGLCVRSIFNNADQWIGKTVTLSGDKMTLKEYAQRMTHEMYPYVFQDGQITPEEFVCQNQWDGAEDMANYFDYLTRGVQRNNQMTTNMLLDRSALTFYDWIKINENKLIEYIVDQQV